MPFLKGHQLFGFLDGSFPIHPPMLDDKSNPAHTRWLQQNQLIIYTLNSSLSKNVLAQVLIAQPRVRFGPRFKYLFFVKSTIHIAYTQY